MEITLISPYEEIYAFGVRILSSRLKKEGHNVRLIFLRNCFYDRYKDKVLHEVVELSKEADLIGISLMTNLFENTVQITQILKKNLRAPIVWGGIHPTIQPEECLEHADMVCMGEGEETLVELVRRLSLPAGLYDIEGLCLKDRTRIIKNKLRPLIRSLDSIPFPDYSNENHYLLDDGHIVAMSESLLKKHFWSHSVYPVLATRGCPFSCSYCCNNTINQMWPEHKSVRKRSIKNIITELSEAKKKLTFIESIVFDDDAFFIYSLEEIQEFHALYKKNIGLPFVVSGITPTTFNKEKFSILVDAGLAGARIGIQSGSERTKKLYKRNYPNAQVEKVALEINEFKDRFKLISYDIILDNPWEKEEDLVETLMLLTRLPVPYSLGLFSLTFYPQTELYKQAKKDNLILDEKEEVRNKSFFGFKKSYLNQLFVLVNEYTSVGSRISSRQMLLLTDKRLRRLKLSYLLYFILKIKVNRIPWIKDVFFKVSREIKRGDLSIITLHIKKFFKHKRF